MSRTSAPPRVAGPLPGAAPAEPATAPHGAYGPAAAAARRRVESLLGDPADPANPYGSAGAADGPPPPVPAEVLAELRPVEAGGRYEGADRLARVLRPVFGRDLLLAHHWAVRPLLEGGPQPERAAETAALLGPVALLGAAGGMLRAAVRAAARPSSGHSWWRSSLAEVFADLLACECLATVALRSVDRPEDDPSVLVAAVGYVVPQVVGEVLDVLELVLHETGPAGRKESVRLTRLSADRMPVGVDWTTAARWQRQLVQALPELGTGGRTAGAPPAPALPPGTLFRFDEPPAGDPGPGGHHAVSAALDGFGGRAGQRESADPRARALAATARRLVTEKCAVRGQCRTAVDADPGDPAVRALADRQALLLLAGAVLGVAGTGTRGFLGKPGWALLALTRTAERLGLPLPGGDGDPRAEVWAELAGRVRRGVDCDVHATALLW